MLTHWFDDAFTLKFENKDYECITALKFALRDNSHNKWMHIMADMLMVCLLKGQFSTSSRNNMQDRQPTNVLSSKPRKWLEI